MLNWREYAVQRKQKKARYAGALDEYQETLLHEGARQWLTVANDVQQIRQRFAAQQGAKVGRLLLHVYSYTL